MRGFTLSCGLVASVLRACASRRLADDGVAPDWTHRFGSSFLLA